MPEGLELGSLDRAIDTDGISEGLKLSDGLKLSSNDGAIDTFGLPEVHIFHIVISTPVVINDEVFTSLVI